MSDANGIIVIVISCRSWRMVRERIKLNSKSNFARMFNESILIILLTYVFPVVDWQVAVQKFYIGKIRIFNFLREILFNFFLPSFRA